MKRITTILVITSAVLVAGSCTTLDVFTVDIVDDTNHVIDIPAEIDQEEWRPGSEASLYNSQSILYSELGSRFYHLGEREIAVAYFENAIEFDRYNNQAHFALGTIAFDTGDYTSALFHFQQIRRQRKLAPYDINYFTAAQLFLDFFPFRARVTAIDPTEYATEKPVVIINVGRHQGVKEGMEFTVYREGNSIRDVKSLEVIGRQRTQIASGIVVQTNQDNAVVEIVDQQDPLYVQLDDLLETNYLSRVPEAVYDEGIGADTALGAAREVRQ